MTFGQILLLIIWGICGVIDIAYVIKTGDFNGAIVIAGAATFFWWLG